MTTDFMSATYRLFIDDMRKPPVEVGNPWLIAKSSKQAMEIVRSLGLPYYISFDHDLGGDDTAMVFLRELTEYMLDRKLSFDSDFEYYVHSQNPVGRKNIIAVMDTLVEYTKQYAKETIE